MIGKEREFNRLINLIKQIAETQKVPLRLNRVHYRENEREIYFSLNGKNNDVCKKLSDVFIKKFCCLFPKRYMYHAWKDNERNGFFHWNGYFNVNINVSVDKQKATFKFLVIELV